MLEAYRHQVGKGGLLGGGGRVRFRAFEADARGIFSGEHNKIHFSYMCFEEVFQSNTKSTSQGLWGLSPRDTALGRLILT